MNEFGASTYGDKIAEIYDKMYPDRANTEPTVRALAELAREGPALELGIGTGRIAIPLAERGIAVHGIDASEAMIAKLRTKPGGAEVSVAIGDFADVDIDGKFPLVFVAFNTFFGLTTQENQVRCFRNVADHLTDNGVFVIEAFVPDMTRYVRGQNISVTRVETDMAVLDLTLHDSVNQSVTSHHLVIAEDGMRLYPVQLRYAWPSELDLMAQLAGLSLHERWGDWEGAPFTSSSTSHISIYKRV
jgi:SAM-dependent methyltransferase